MKALLLLALCATIISIQCTIFRLPASVKPLRYTVTIEPNMSYIGWQRSSYWGAVAIELEVLENTDNVTLHASEIDIDDTSIRVTSNGRAVKVKNALKVKQDQVYVIELEETLLKNKFYNVSIGKFQAYMSSNSRGLYKAHYSHNGEERVVAVTHFEPTWARYAFPCFDEPHLKAKFAINLIRGKEYNSIANEALQTTKSLGANRYMDVFKETPPMPTYAVAFAVSDFPSTRKVERHRILARPDAFDELEYPLMTSVKALRILEEYIGVNFTLSKMDTFAVPPGYFRHFAMENWGLITFQEDQLRCSNKTNPITLTTITSYIAHEFAHQWFGNLVTPALWDYIWLSESFSAYFQYYIAAKVQPMWRIMEQFVVTVVQGSFYDEQHQGAHPLNFRISRYGQFPPFHIMYQKGSSIVRMMSHFLTDEVFRKALHSYIVEKQFTSVVPDDLYRSVQKTIAEEGIEHLLGGMRFDEVMQTWDSYKGYPIVTVTRNYSSGDINITQRSRTFGDEQVWKIPINYVVSSKGVDFSKTTADVWLINATMALRNMSRDGWVIVNKQQFGYYRVNYDLENWERLIQVLKSDKFGTIHVLNRAQLINDAFYFASIEEIPIDIPYRLAEYLVREKDYIPFAAFYTTLSNYGSIYFGNTKATEKQYFLNHPLSNSIKDEEEEGGYSRDYLIFKEYIRTILANIRADIGTEERPTDTYEQKVLRTELDRYFPYYFE
uniref:Aminopeptidase n=1 Tax=Photinus pyralis TaxID=7054 RepID=A0A1Y1KZ69_PHOPY